MMQHTHPTPQSKCLQCGYLMNAAGSTDGRPIEPPEPGNLAVCLRCGAVMMYADDLTVRGMTVEEMDDLTNDREAMNGLARLVKRIQLIPKIGRTGSIGGTASRSRKKKPCRFCARRWEKTGRRLYRENNQQVRSKHNHETTTTNPGAAQAGAPGS